MPRERWNSLTAGRPLLPKIESMLGRAAEEFRDDMTWPDLRHVTPVSFPKRGNPPEATLIAEAADIRSSCN
jgi:hypothetical protein